MFYKLLHYSTIGLGFFFIFCVIAAIVVFLVGSLIHYPMVIVFILAVIVFIVSVSYTMACIELDSLWYD